jgi:hypothetical protein
LQRPAKPKISVDILTSERLHEEYNAAVEAWGDGLAAQVDRLCRFERQLGGANVLFSLQRLDNVDVDRRGLQVVNRAHVDLPLALVTLFDL